MSGRIISRAESWETVYQAFQNINFTAFDYQTIKQSMIDYIKLYFPETFTDYIESSEFIALLELFAYLGEITAYRIDMASHENFLPTAQRKQSILRLAKLISYNASRNIPARGLVKITSVSTTETVFDSRGTNLANVKITWNDISNPNWKEQFLLVMDKILKQPFGSVRPSDRVQVQDTLFELYSLNNEPLPRNVISFFVNVSEKTYPMELVPVALDENGPYEKRPEINAQMTLLYGTDGLGDESPGTGFFLFCKQGELQLLSNTFDGITPNQTFEIGLPNINETDVWVNNVDPETLQIITGNENFTRNKRSGEWVQVDLAHAQNVIFNTNVVRNKYEIETLENDAIRIIFGDGEFASIPSGLFHFWVRTSANEDLVIPQTSINNVESSLTYRDVYGNIQTFSFTFSSTGTFQNAAKTEDIEHIRRMAPAVYYTQDRMVNGKDYNTFMLQDPSILKIRSFNRTFSGDSVYTKFVAFSDPSGAYDNIKVFGDDLAIFIEENIQHLPEIHPSVGVRTVLKNHVEPLLSNPNLFLYRSTLENLNTVRLRMFTSNEFEEIADMLTLRHETHIGYLIFDISENKWKIHMIPIEESDLFEQNPSYYIRIIKGTQTEPWRVSFKTTKLNIESPQTKFWFAEERRVVNYDSLNPGNDVVCVLKANDNKNRDGILPSNINFIVLGHNYVSTGSGPIYDIGLVNYNQLSVIYEDKNGDSIPDLPAPYGNPLDDLISPEYTITAINISKFVDENNNLFFPFPVLKDDIIFYQGESLISDSDYIKYTLNSDVIIGIKFKQEHLDYLNTGEFKFKLNEYVYFSRTDSDSYWKVLPTIPQTLFDYKYDDSIQYKRLPGRYPLNFLWIHKTPNNHLVDPASTNIIDTYIITRGYYISMRRWLDGYFLSKPEEPSSLELRTSYSYMIDNKMISDSVILHSGKFKILFGSKAIPELQAKFKVIKSPLSTLTDNQIKLNIITAVKDFFDINKWEFGETFYFTELAAVIHAALPVDIESVVIVPLYPTNYFGDLFQVNCREDEIFIPDITINDIDIISSISRPEIRQF